MRRSGNLFKQSACESAEVRFVRFCTFSKAELESWSVAEITESRIYEGNQPVHGGPNDLRLGVNTMEFPCATCGERRECQGHFGHIKLLEPVFHYGFMDYAEKILKCICHNCSKMKLFTVPPLSHRPNSRARSSARSSGSPTLTSDCANWPNCSGRSTSAPWRRRSRGGAVGASSPTKSQSGSTGSWWNRNTIRIR